MTDAAWRELDAELDRWAAAGRQATFWLRDDDATEATGSLDRLLDLTEPSATPLALAVVPVGAKPSLVRRLERADSVSVLQHGYAHANHSVRGAKKSEFADERSLEAMMGELVQGRDTIFRMFGAAALPVLAPPWNRFAAALPARLADCGLFGLSGFKPRTRRMAAPGVVVANAHVDLIAWRAGRTGKPAAAIGREVAAHLANRRIGAVDASEPTGLLTHHLVMDATAWSSLEFLLRRLARDRRVAWPTPADIFRSGDAEAPA